MAWSNRHGISRLGVLQYSVICHGQHILTTLLLKENQLEYTQYLNNWVSSSKVAIAFWSSGIQYNLLKYSFNETFFIKILF